MSDQTIRWQANRIEELEAELAYLKSELDELNYVADRTIWCDVFRLPPKQGQILDLLLRARGVARRSWISDVIWGREDLGKVLDVHITLIRKAMRKAGLGEVIVTKWGTGWYIDEPDRARIRQMGAEYEQQAAAKPHFATRKRAGMGRPR